MKAQEFELENFSKFGKNFQEKLVHCMFYDRSFFDQMVDIFDIYFLELKYLRKFYSRLASYRETYEKHPSADIMASVIKTELDDETEVVKKQVRDYFARIVTTDIVEDSEYVKATAIDFCKKQKLKGALMQSVDLIQNSSYDEVRRVIDTALKLGTEKDQELFPFKGSEKLPEVEEILLLFFLNMLGCLWFCASAPSVRCAYIAGVDQLLS